MSSFSTLAAFKILFVFNFRLFCYNLYWRKSLWVKSIWKPINFINLDVYISPQIWEFLATFKEISFLLFLLLFPSGAPIMHKLLHLMIFHILCRLSSLFLTALLWLDTFKWPVFEFRNPFSGLFKSPVYGLHCIFHFIDCVLKLQNSV